MYIYSKSGGISTNRKVSDMKDSCVKSYCDCSSFEEENGVSWSIYSYGANSRK